jgi:predicted alpha/beta superfamily hydrolase
MNADRALLALAAILFCAIAGCGGGGGSGGEVYTTPPPTGSRTGFDMASQQTGITYSVQVYTPPGYATSAERYPVVYATDAEYRFTVLSGVLEGTQRKAILVNIGAMGTNRRWVDFTMPGAEAYYRFLTQELVPAIDAQYRTQPENRILTGHSLSGEFVMYALYLELPGKRVFSAFISEEGSFWAMPNQFFQAVSGAEPSTSMERAMFERDRSLPVTLVMAGDATSNYRLVFAVHNELAARGYTGLRLVLNAYSMGHVPMDGPAFTDAMNVILGPT